MVLCCDEKSQVQALERTQPGLPLGIGHIRTQSHDYIRHGTVTLFTALDYLQGRLISSIRELESSITTFLALRNAQPTHYVWNAKGEDILKQIQRAREAMASQA